MSTDHGFPEITVFHNAALQSFKAAGDPLALTAFKHLSDAGQEP